MNWIDVNKQQPEVYQDVVFIVESWDKHYNKRILGGRYQGFRYGDDEFSVPGISFKGVYWMPLPPLPDELIDTKQTEK